MILIPYDSLVISDDRQRKEFTKDKLEELAGSIQKLGLMHPLVVRPLEDGTWKLVAGERRLLSIKALHEAKIPFLVGGQICPPGQLPVVPMSQLNAIEAEEAELDENLRRTNLSWSEEAAAIARLTRLRQAQADMRNEELQLPLRPITARSVAAELVTEGETQGPQHTTRVTTALILDQHLDDPEVQKAKSAKEALKVIEKKAQAQHRAKLAESFNQKETPHRLVNLDSREWLKTLPDNTFDLILTDPPYGVGADTFGDMSKTGHNYKDTPEYALDCYDVTFKEGFRVAKSRAAMYVFCTIELWPLLSLSVQVAGWNLWPRPLIWNKTNGMLPKPNYGPRYTYETIIFATKGEIKVQKVGAPDVLTFPMRSELDHGAQKPVDLFVELINRSCLPGAQVLDPFAGSGTIFPAATRAKVQATGCELIPENYHMGLARMKERNNIAELIAGARGAL